MTSALDRLTALLTAAADTAPTPRELAELLWLAGLSSDPEETSGRTEQAVPDAAAAAAARAERDTGGAPDDGTGSGPDPADADRTAGSTPPKSAPGDPADRVSLHLPTPAPAADSGDGSGSAGRRPVLAPAPPMLPHPSPSSGPCAR